jgi:ketosteroid isomerase-like protein
MKIMCVVFRALENGHRGKFLDHVADNVDWIVEGAHSLVARYRSKGDLLAGSFANRIVPLGAQLVVEHVTVRLSDENRNQIQPPRRSHNGKVRGVRGGEGP